LRITQGRFEEAERLLSGIKTRPESIRPVVTLHMERGELAPAASVLHRRLRQMGSESVGAVPFLAMLVTVQIARATSTVPGRRRIQSKRWRNEPVTIGPWPKAIWRLVVFS
jgi:hypothetical protein